MLSRQRLIVGIILLFLTLVGLSQVHPTTRHARVHTWVQDSKTWLASANHCNPYESYGQLRIDLRDPLENRWIPFDETCAAPRSMASLARLAWNGTLPKTPLAEKAGEAIMADTDPDGLPWQNMEWARGRTVVAHGDSVVRFAMTHFCQMLTGNDPVDIDEQDQYWPYTPDEIYVVGEDPAIESPGPQSGRFERAAKATKHGSKYCYAPELDFLYIFTFNFGLDTFGYYAKQEYEVVGPYSFENKLDFVTRRIVDKAGRGEPDMVFLGSALWDNMRWLKEDLKEGRDPKRIISNDRINWYGRRIGEVVAYASTVFPVSPIRWIGHTFPVHVQSNGWFFAGVEKDKRPEQLLQRLWRMTHAARQAVQTAGKTADVGFVPWGQSILGTQDYQVDDLHQAMFPGSYVWADMMLYELGKCVGI